MQSHMSGRFFGVAVIALLLGAVAARAQDTELQFYTSVPRELSAPLAERFTAVNSGIKVNLFEAGAETVLGNVINPYFPQNIYLFVEHFVEKIKIGSDFPDTTGSQASPTRTG